MKDDSCKDKALRVHIACCHGASLNVVKMSIDLGGKELVMAKDNNGNTALHWLCYCINRHTKSTASKKSKSCSKFRAQKQT